MKVEVLYFEGCPNHVPAVERVREALQSENETADVQEIEVSAKPVSRPRRNSNIPCHIKRRCASFIASYSCR
jgi:hypothetical protein